MRGTKFCILPALYPVLECCAMKAQRQLSKAAGLLLCGACMMGCSHSNSGSSTAAAESSSGGNASAKIEKPVALDVPTGFCESDGSGTIGANFNDKVAFNIGPKTGGAAMLGMNTAPYKGAGSYTKVIITGFVDPKNSFGGLGTVTFNADRRTGTFVTDDGKGSGTFDCGSALK